MSVQSYARRVEFFVSHASRRSKLLDEASVLFIGCGKGNEALCLQILNPRLRVIGLDIMLPRLGGRAQQFEFVRADASHLPFRDHALDFCYCYHVLEHVTDYVACVRETA